jgi:hypothetical protein
MKKQDLITLHRILNRLGENNESYFRNSFIYGCTVKVPFPESYWAYNMETNFLEFLVLKDDTAWHPNNFIYLPKNKANKKYIIIGGKSICKKICDIYSIKNDVLKLEMINKLSEDIYPILKKKINEEMVFMKELISKIEIQKELI